MPPIICMIATGEAALKEMQMSLSSLETWHPDATIYLYTDSQTAAHTLKFKGKIHVKKALNAYKGLRRADMEARSGTVYSSLITDFFMEKANVMQWAFDTDSRATTDGVWYIDSDITMLAPLPEIPASATIALSPHYIRKGDEDIYGIYNGGMLWANDSKWIAAWKGATHRTKFEDQGALELIVEDASDELYKFPPQVNFGWWRMYQAAAAPPDVQAKFSYCLTDKSVGIRYDGAPLQSIHTHWNELTGYIGAFNAWIYKFMSVCKSYKPMVGYRRLVSQLFKVPK
jgi:hypothetical protein